MIDNTFASPYLCRPIEWGADIVVHSATKFIGGHGTSIGGIVVESGRLQLVERALPGRRRSVARLHGLAFHETFGVYGYLMKLRAETLRDLGAAISPFNAFLFLMGLETLPLRMARHVENARGRGSSWRSTLASKVGYPGLPGSRYAPLVAKYLPRGAGAVFSFDFKGGREAGQRFIEAHALEAPGERRRREEPGHPSRQHDPPPAQRRGVAGGGHRRGDDPPLGRHGDARRPALGPRAGLRARGGGGMSCVRWRRPRSTWRATRTR